MGYGDGEWEKLLYSNDGGMTWTTYTFEVKQAYSITVNASQNGTVTANEYAIEGDNIALNVSPAEGYMLDTLSVTDASGNSVTVENNQFTMPASAVTVTATFAVCDHKDSRHETATDNGDGTHDATCSVCGKMVDNEAHIGGKATCTDKAVCDLCDVSYGDFADHSMDYVADEEANTITYRCGTCDTQTVTFTLVIPTGAVYGSSAMAVPHYDCSDKTYNGELPMITLDGKELKDFVPNAGTYAVTMTWGGKTVSVDFTIAKAEVSIATAPTPNSGLTYIGEAQYLISAGEAVGGTMVYSLTEEGEYTTSIPQGTNAGEYTVWYYVQGDANHNDSAKDSVDVTIAKVEPKAEDFIFQAPGDLTYNGETKSASVSVKTGIVGMGDIIAVMYYNGDSNIAVEKQPVSAGNYFVQINVAEGENYTEKSFFGGENWVFTIAPMQIYIDPDFGATLADVVYNESGVYTLTVTGVAFKSVGVGNTVPLTLGTDYTATATQTDVSYGELIKAVTATVDVTLKNGNYQLVNTNVCTATANIVEHEHAWTYTADGDTITATCGNADTCSDPEQSITLAVPENYTYTGEALYSASVDGSIDGVTYTVNYTGMKTNYSSANAPVNADTYTVTLTAGDKSVSDSFTISPKNISKVASCQFSLTQTSFVYSGKAPVLNVTGVDSSVGSYTMQEGTDYTVGTVQVNAGSHKLTVTGIGNYTGTVELDYTITAKEVSITGAAIQAVTYDPNGYTLTVTGVTFDGVVDGETLAYTAEATLGNTNAVGEQDATVTVTLNNSNYTLEDATYETTVTINKAEPKIVWNSGYRNSYGRNMYITAYINGVDGNLLPGTAIATVCDAEGNELNAVACTKTDSTGAYGFNWLNRLTDGTYLAPGTYQVKLTYQGDENYNAKTVELVTYTISKADPVIGTVGCEMDLYDSTAISSVELTRTDMSVEGTLVLTDSELTAGEGTYNWKFTPKDTDNYNTITGTVVLTVTADVVEQIRATGTLEKFSYVYGEPFSIDGMTVTASYTSGTTKDVTGLVSFDRTLAVGQTAVELTYQGKICVIDGITVARKQLDVSGMAWDIPENAVYSGTAYNATLTGNLPEGVTVTKTGYTATNAGSYTAKSVFSLAEGYSADNYEIVNGGDLTADWTIAKKNIAGAEITLGTALTYNGEQQTQTVASVKIDGLTVSYTVSGNTGTDAKGYTLTVTGNGNFEGTAAADWTIAKKNISGAAITLGDSLTYNGSVQTQAVTEVKIGDLTVTYDVTANKQLGAGDYTLTVTGNGNFEGSATADWSIAKAKLTVTANDNSITYGDVPAANGVTGSGFITGESFEDLSGELAYSYNYEQFGNVGTYRITPSGVTSNNYEITFADGTLTVNTKAITVKADAVSKVYGEADPKLTYKAEGLVNGDELTGQLKRAAGENVGAYAITLGTLANSNYAITFTGAELTVTKRDATITAKDQTVTYGETISGTEITATGLADGHNVTVTLTPSTANVTANGTITAGAAVITADGTDVTGNYNVSCISGKLMIEPDTSKIDGLTSENVTSANEEDIKAVQEMMASAESVKDEWNAIGDICEELIEKIEAVETARKEAADEAAAFDGETVKSTDKAELDQLAENIEALLDTKNLTEDERKALEDVLTKVNGMIDTIEDSAEQSKAATDAIDALDSATVTSDDKDELELAIETIDKLLTADHLTETERKALTEAKAEAEALIDVIDAAQDAANTENTEKVENTTADNVKPEDREALEAAKADLEKALKDNSSNYTEEEKKAIQDEIQRVDDAIEAVEHSETVEKSVTALPETVEPDDEAAAEKILAVKKNYDALTSHEKSMVDEAVKEKLEKLVAALTDYDIIKGDGSQWDAGDNVGISFTANGAFSKFTGIKVEGKTVDAKHYHAKSGSTVITLKASYLETLAPGTYTLTVLYTDGETSGTFQIQAQPTEPEGTAPEGTEPLESQPAETKPAETKPVETEPVETKPEASSPGTGDDSNIVLYGSVFAVSFAALAALLLADRKRKQKNA